MTYNKRELLYYENYLLSIFKSSAEWFLRNISDCMLRAYNRMQIAYIY